MKDSRPKVTNKSAGKYLENQEAFRGSNLDAMWVSDKWYVVFSYGWHPIFAYDKENDYWLENANTYSRSTAKQMSSIRPWHSKIIVADLLSHRPWTTSSLRNFPALKVA